MTLRSTSNPFKFKILYYFVKIRSHFEEIVQNLELRRVGGAPKGLLGSRLSNHPISEHTRRLDNSKWQSIAFTLARVWYILVGVFIPPTYVTYGPLYPHLHGIFPEYFGPKVISYRLECTI